MNLPAGVAFNAGPGRISHHHRAVLHYCRRFQLPLRPFLTLNRAALVHRWIPSLQRDVVVRNRQMHFDGLGRLGELASRFDPCLDGDAPLPAELKPALRQWLDEAMNVVGARRRPLPTGWAPGFPPGPRWAPPAGRGGRPPQPGADPPAGPLAG